MGKVIVVEFVTLDGVVEDPDGSAGLPGGGWAFHAGPEVFAGDKFRLGPILRVACSCSAARPGSCSPASGRPAPTTSPTP